MLNRLPTLPVVRKGVRISIAGLLPSAGAIQVGWGGGGGDFRVRRAKHRKANLIKTLSRFQI